MTPASPALQPLPIGIQSFAKLRKENYLYVDKTADIHRLVTTSATVFLSRPRRFGKSLLLSTLEELFKGNEPLFRGLAIHNKWDWTQQYPVIRIDWTGFKCATVADFDRRLALRFGEMAEQHGVTLAAPCLEELIRKLHQKTGRQVVVLVDEYDKLLLDALGNEAEFIKARDYLRSVYVVLKAESEHIRFVFLTGVSKFAGVSIFSGLNNLDDITLDSSYATICGYTQTELEENFSDYIITTSEVLKCDGTKLLEGMRTWYNGYSWDAETSVYNPYSVLLFFRKQHFSNYWFQTATPSFLVELAKKDAQILTIIESENTYCLETPDANPAKLNMLSLLFQTGYLTIKEINKDEFGEWEHTLGFPNTEVRKSFLTSLLSVYSETDTVASNIRVNAMRRDLAKGDAAAFEKQLRALLRGIPYLLTSPNTESIYHVITLTWLQLLGFKVRGEEMTDTGRIDAVWELPNQVIIIEIKLSHVIADASDAAVVAAEKEKLFAAAFAQMKTKGYADAYMNDFPKVSLFALAFYGKEVSCRLEVLKEG